MAWNGDWSLVVGRGGGYEYFPSGYVLLDCNLTGLVSCSHIIYQVHLSGYILSGYVLSGYVLSGSCFISDF